jgi:Lon protease-like protein
LTDLPLFPLRTVLFPGGLLPLKVFEQRYIEMTKACLRDGRPFGVCLITRGDEVAREGAPSPDFATVGTLALKQAMLEVNDANARLEALRQFLDRQGLLEAVRK